jgi:hypothetical protein
MSALTLIVGGNFRKGNSCNIALLKKLEHRMPTHSDLRASIDDFS